MKPSLEGRIKRLEQNCSPSERRFFRVPGFTAAEHAAGIETLKRDSGATDNDVFICRFMVAPPWEGRPCSAV